jgi:hypothetical protein
MASPGTLYRIFTADRSKHYTAVLLKDGKLLEVKNPDGGEKVMFDSLDLFKEARLTEGGVVESMDKVTACKERKEKVDRGEVCASGKKVRAKKIRCPNKKYEWSKWLLWVYSMMKEGLRYLLTNEEVIDAYNNYGKILYKYGEELCGNTSKSGKYYRYNQYNIINPKDGVVVTHPYNTNGPQIWFKKYFGTESAKYSKEDYNRMREEINAGYAELHKHIGQPLLDYINKVNTIDTLRRDIRYHNRVKSLYGRRLTNLQNRYTYDLEYLTNIMTNTTKKLEDAEKKLAELIAK